MPTVLLATCADLPHGDEDGAMLVDALSRADVPARWTVWTQADADPASADALVVIRSTWDYHRHLSDFLAWIDGLPHVANPAPVLRWSSDKTYLRDLERAGLPVVETTFLDTMDDWATPDAAEFVVKPSVGAGSRGAGRFTRERAAEARAHAEALLGAGRTVLVQPYVADVDTAGETALLYFDGRFSHAIRKGPMLGTDVTHAVDGPSLFIEENITAREPEPDQLALGEAVTAHLRDRFGADQLYARVDLLPGPCGPVVTELELVEPSLFLVHDPTGAADRFAAAIARRV